MELSSILAIMGIITPFALSGVWVATLVTKVSNRALLLEVAKDDHAKRITDLEHSTSYSSVEKVVEKICHRIFESKEFKDSMKSSIKESMIHFENAKSHQNSLIYTDLMDEIKKMHADISKIGDRK